MSRDDVAALRAASAAQAAGKPELFYALLAPDVVWDTSRSAFPDAGVYHGREGVRSWFGGLRDAFGEDVRYELRDLQDFGDQVLMEIRAVGQGRTSGIGVDWGFVSVMTFRDGKVVRMDRFADRSEALHQLGVAQ